MRLSRSNFIKGLSLALAGQVARSTVWSEVTLELQDRATDILAGLLVFDGIVNIAANAAATRTLKPGTIKASTGINIGNHSLRVVGLAEVNQLCADHPDALLRIDRARDLQTALSSNRFGLVYYVQQGFDLKGSVEPLSLWKSQGLRCLQLTYTDNALGGGSESDDTPLSQLGHKVVAELNRLHMVVDVSHTGRRTTLDAAQASTYPITANHANAGYLTSHRRNKTDEELKAIAATGGVVGVTSINRFILRNGNAPATIADFVNHVDYIVGKIGIDHVGISSDSHIDGTHRYDVDYSDPLLSSANRWRHVTRRLLEKGYKKEHLEKLLGLNFKRVYEKVLDP